MVHSSKGVKVTNVEKGEMAMCEIRAFENNVLQMSLKKRRYRNVDVDEMSRFWIM